jgi:hypothetical protein
MRARFSLTGGRFMIAGLSTLALFASLDCGRNDGVMLDDALEVLLDRDANPAEVGRCCSVVPGARPELIPRVVRGTEVIVDVGIDCPELACIAEGGAPFVCTRSCVAESDCPGESACVEIAGGASAIKFCSSPSDVCFSRQ